MENQNVIHQLQTTFRQIPEYFNLRKILSLCPKQKRRMCPGPMLEYFNLWKILSICPKQKRRTCPGPTLDYTMNPTHQDFSSEKYLPNNNKLDDESSDEDKVYEPLQNGDGGQNEFNPDNFFELVDLTVTNIKHFNTQGRVYPLRFNNLEQMEDLKNQASILQRIIEIASEDVEDNAHVGFSFGHPELKNGPLLVPF
uniref:Uncharacterized protein n=1 Tax=Romanomermis culicivorax TaxID=13658 RepID=A0A915L2V1_ROMCU